MRFLLLVLMAAFIFLQYELWCSNGGIISTLHHKSTLANKKHAVAVLQNNNKKLAADISDLRKGHQAIEGEARAELGMVKKGEVFYQVVQQRATS